MSRPRGLMSGVLTPIGAAFAAPAAAVFLALPMLFSARMPVLAVLMVLLWRWVDRFSDQRRVI